MEHISTNQDTVCPLYGGTVTTMSVAKHIAKDYLFQVGDVTALRLLFNRHMDPGMLERFITFDRGVTVKEVTDALGYQFCRRYLNTPDLHKVGYIAAKTPYELQTQHNISGKDIDRIRSYLERHDLSFGMDTSQWLLYRKMVPRGFELIRIDDPSAPYLSAGSQDYLV